MENNETNKTGNASDAGFSKDEDFNWEADTSKAKVSDSVKKILSTGMSAVMMSEEVVRQYLQDVKVPKDVAGTLFKSISKSREELVTRAGNELSKLIGKIDVVDELTKFLRENKIKLSAEVEFTKKDKTAPSATDQE
jgi:hypothetical protein